MNSFQSTTQEFFADLLKIIENKEQTTKREQFLLRVHVLKRDPFTVTIAPLEGMDDSKAEFQVKKKKTCSIDEKPTLHTHKKVNSFSPVLLKKFKTRQGAKALKNLKWPSSLSNLKPSNSCKKA